MFDFPNSPTLNQTLTGPNGILYKWDGVKWTISLAAGPYLPLTGGTLSGPLILNGDPSVNLQAATKQYVDTHVPVGGGILEAPLDGKWYGRLSGAWSPVLPITGGTITGNLSVTGTTTLSNTLTVNATANASNLAVGSPTVPSDALAGSLRMNNNAISNETAASPLLQLASNAYETNSGNAWKYLTTGTASVVSFRGDGTWGWFNAVSGTAGAVVPWISRMSLAANGDLSTTGAATFAGGGTFNGGSVSLNGTGAGAYASLTLNSGSGAGASQISGLRTGTQRWLLQMPNGVPDGASNAGSNFAIYAYDNTGAYLNSPFSIDRASGQVNVGFRLNVGGDTFCGAASYSTNGLFAGGYGDTSFGMFRQGNAHYFQFGGNFYMQGDVSNGNVIWVVNSGVRASLSGAGAFSCATSLSAGTSVSASTSIQSNNGRIISVNSSNNPSLCCWDQAGYAGGMFLSAGSSGVLYLGRMDGSGAYIGLWYANFTDIYATFNGIITTNGTGSNTFNGPLTLQNQSNGILYKSGYGATNNTINLGWSNAVVGLASISVDNGGAFYSIANGSDARLKHSIADTEFDCLAGVLDLKVREFNWITFDAENPDPWKLRQARDIAAAKGRGDHIQNRFGLVAQEVAETLPEGVQAGDDFDDHLGQVWNLDSNTMIALLVGAVQQLTARVNTLEQA